ncbi:MAG: imelysin family protein [Filomicrobium sp.]
MRSRLATIAVLFFCFLVLQVPARAAENAIAVSTNYADLALAKYSDALAAAKEMERSIDALIAGPSAQTLKAAQDAWIRTRIPYQQTEVYRFGNPIVDNWEGQVNAWPLDEGLIDYVSRSYEETFGENELYLANVIANKKLKIGGKDVDASVIDKKLLADTLQEANGIEANVATGFHAIEFLLWGQDLNGTEAGKGARPATDFDTANCTGGNCDRRAAYLKAATTLLVDDLTWMVAQWQDGGAARKAVLEQDGIRGLVSLFTGMGSLSYGELAGERMKLGLLLHDPEEEHDCFSDNTHASHYYNAIGIRNVYIGKYVRPNGEVVSGPSVSEMVRTVSPEADKRVLDALDVSVAKLKAIFDRAETTEAYDQMLAEGNAEGNRMIEDAVEVLLAQTREITNAIQALKLTAIAFQGSSALE